MSFANLKISPTRRYCDIYLQTDPLHISTASYGNISEFFESQLASIFQCQCDNPGKLAFAEELKNTEVGHLVEHVLLEFLCKEKLKLGHKEAQYAGHTNWNWTRDPFGSFRIRIMVGLEEKPLLDKALAQTMALLSKLPPPKAGSHLLPAWCPSGSD